MLIKSKCISGLSIFSFLIYNKPGDSVHLHAISIGQFHRAVMMY